MARRCFQCYSIYLSGRNLKCYGLIAAWLLFPAYLITARSRIPWIYFDIDSFL